MKNILISGITGFVGFNLKDYLNGFYQINGISRKANEKSLIYDYGHAASLLDTSFAFIHLAGKAHDLKNVCDDKEYFDVNTELTKKLYNQFLNSNCEVFIYMSSVKAVADSLTAPLDESHVPHPTTVYGKSKLEAEKYIISKTIPTNKRLYILRPCMIHGPGNKGNLNLLFKLISKGIPYPLAAFENKRSFLSIENLCFVIREIVERNDIPSGIYQVADDEPLSTNELIKLIAGASERKPQLWNISPGLIRSIAKLGNVLHLPLTTERLNKLTENYIVDNAKIRKALGKELPVRARDGILKTIKSFHQRS